MIVPSGVAAVCAHRTERRTAVPRAWRVLLDLWLLARPAIWLVSLVPFYVGHLLATRRLVAGQDACVPPGGGCAEAAAPVLLGLVVWGPLVWLAVLAINDAFDLDGDLRNPRKADAPLVEGRLGVRGALVAAHLTAAGALLVALTVRPAFALVTFGFLVLGWMYSVPPVRLKDRPGFDVATNAVGVGGLAPLAGWTVVRPVGGFPWAMAVLGVLVATALYVPTTVTDYKADLASGYRTIAVRLGPRRAHRIGLAAWTAACAGAVALAAAGHVFPQRTLWVQAIFAPLLVWLYHRRLGRAREPGEVVHGLVVVCWVFLVPYLVFALAYTSVF
ncbi:UbiA prenyltransferase family protein [Actinomadura algeriensis]|uniref:Chlorophyll synthase n=1 Tax=Actinomadura algeriensis TaxID=1679523 RepID=A0ABR9JXN3_9ACTN|nr:UbiA prenyltransferase family protein [Actinomadura algeriensis]MBE1534855.1 chlorophyll synthase [Actinomadura algeriensis]